MGTVFRSAFWLALLTAVFIPKEHALAGTIVAFLLYALIGSVIFLIYVTFAPAHLLYRQRRDDSD